MQDTEEWKRKSKRMNEFSRRAPVDAYLRAFNVLIGSMLPRKKMKNENEIATSYLSTYVYLPTYLFY